MPIKIAINGFGRIGRAALKIALEKENVEVVAVNDAAGARVLAHLLKYDTVYGTYPKKVEIEEDGVVVKTEGLMVQHDHFEETTAKEVYLVVDGKRTRVLSEMDPTKLPWGELDVDVVLECTGAFTKNGAAVAHITAGAKKAVVSAPVKGEGNVPTFLLGANHDQYIGQNVISNASCTTNCISPAVKVIFNKFGILKSAMTTIHSVTASQSTVDGMPRKGEDLRLSRAGLQNIIPTTTGAAKATTQVIPELQGVFDGIAIRVPTLVGSLSDITFLTKAKTTVEEVNQAYIEASEQDFYKGILGVAYEPIVSSDIIGSTYSSIIDLTMTRVIDGDLVKVLAWYDNEWGYTCRLVEMALLTHTT